MPADNRYAFLVEWLDPQAQLVRQYLLFYYSIDATVEMVSARAEPASRARLLLMLLLLCCAEMRMCARHSGTAWNVADVRSCCDGSRVQDDIKNRRKFLRRCEYPGEPIF